MPACNVLWHRPVPSLHNHDVTNLDKCPTVLLGVATVGTARKHVRLTARTCLIAYRRYDHNQDTQPSSCLRQVLPYIIRQSIIETV